jgi:alpha-glucosidase
MKTAHRREPSSLMATLCFAVLGCAGQGPVSVEGAVATIPTAEALVRVSSPAPGVMRVQLSPPGAQAPSVTSFAVDPEALATPAPLAIDEANGVVTVTGSGAGVRITRSPLRIALLDAEQNVVSEETSSVAFGLSTSLRGKLGSEAHVYGLGDKVGAFDRRGKAFTFWNTDTYGWDARKADPLYKSIPFMLVLEGGRAHGIFIDNPSRGRIDLGAADPKAFLYEAVHAPVWDVYLFAGPETKSVLSAYTALTGRMPLPPRWALGYHQSRWSYPTEGDVREVAAQLRANQFPADVIWLDIGFQQDNAPFTVFAHAFPTFGAMVSDLLALHLRTVVITDPHIKRTPGIEPYASGVAADAFIKLPNGSEYVGNVWPGASVFPDFSLSRVRAWWGGLYEPFVGLGIAGFWNDMNEPAIFDGRMPDDTPHRLDDGTTVDHLTAHNAYGLLNARATFEGVKALRPNARPFVLTRAAYAGTQRWAATWTGDNVANRDHLAVTIPQLTNLGVSGYAFVGADVGGFVGCPDRELLVEWSELGAYQPFFRNHAVRDSCRREPWASGPALAARLRSAIEQRYQMLSYVYTAFEESSRTGVPVMRPLWLEFPNDASTYRNDRAFLLGRDLLVAPRLAAGSSPDWEVELPAADWWDVSTGRLVSGGGSVTVTAASGGSIGLFARAGAIVPQQPVTQWADQNPAGPLTLEVWPGEDCTGNLYLDAGDGYGYQTGELRRITWSCQPHANGISVSSATVSGAFPTWWSSTRVVVHGVPRAPTAVTIGANSVPFDYAEGAQTLTATVPGALADWILAANW